MADAPSPAGMTDEQIVQTTLNLIRPGTEQHRRQETRYNEAFDIWRAKPSPADKLLEDWRSKVRVPYAQGMIDTELANLCAGVPRCVVHPRRPGDEAGAAAMQHLMDYYTAEDHLGEKQPLVVQQALVYGTTVAKNHWAYETGMRNVRRFEPDPVTGRNTLVGTDQQPVVLRDGPCLYPWNVYDAWWDPNGADVDSCAYVVLRSWKTKADLLKDGYNADTDSGLYRNLDKLFQTGPPNQPTQTAQQTMLGGNPSQERKGQFEILEIWTNDTLIVIGNRQVLLRAAPNPYWHRCKPVVIAQTRPDLFEVAGIPETDLIRDIQSVLWTLQNMTIDSLKLTVLRGATYREGFVDPRDLGLRPGFRWPVNNHDDVEFPVFPPVSSDVFTERERLLGDMERVTNVSAYLQGADSSTVNQTTATGVSALQSAANTVMRFKAKVLHDKIFQRTFEQWGDMIQQFLDHDVYLKITGPQGEDAWAAVGPGDVVGGHYRYRLEGSEESLTRQQERNDAIGLLNALAPFVQAGVVNPSPVIKRVASAFDVLDPDSLVQTPPQQQQFPPAAPNNGGFGQQPYQPPQTMNGGSLPIQQQNAIALR